MRTNIPTWDSSLVGGREERRFDVVGDGEVVGDDEVVGDGEVALRGRTEEEAAGDFKESQTTLLP